METRTKNYKVIGGELDNLDYLIDTTGFDVAKQGEEETYDDAAKTGEERKVEENYNDVAKTGEEREEENYDDVAKTSEEKTIQKYGAEIHTILIASDEKGKWNAQMLAKPKDMKPISKETQRGLDARANNVRTFDQVAIDMEEKTADELSDRNSANVLKSSRGKSEGPELNWNNVVQMPDGGFEVYPPNPDGKVDNNAKWIITPQQAAEHGIADDGLDLTTKSSEELNEIVGLTKENVKNHGIEAAKGNSIQSMQQGQDGIDIGDR